MDNNFTPISPESESAAAAASEEAAIYTPPVIIREEPETPKETETPVASYASVRPAPAPEKRSLDYAKIFSSPIYLAICILVTVLTAIEFVTGKLNLLTLLFMIAGWVTFGRAKRKETPLSGMKFTRGVLITQYVLLYILGGLLIILGVGLAAFHFATNFTFKEIIEEAANGLNQYSIDKLPVVGDDLEAFIVYINKAYQMLVNDLASIGISESVLHSILFVSASMILAIFGILVLLFNVLYTRALVVFSGSICRNAQDPDAEIVKAKAVKNWLMVVGIITALLIFRSIWSLFTIGLTSAAMICGSVLTKRYFVEH